MSAWLSFLFIERYGKVYLIFLFSVHQASHMPWRVYSPCLPSSSLFSGRVREKPTRVRDMGRIDQTVARLATALATNFERLEEARVNQMLYPNRRRYQEEVDDYLQGLSAAEFQIEDMWRQFRTNTLTRTTSLIDRVEEETAKQFDQSPAAPTADATAAGGTQAATTAARSSWLKTALNGLIQFKDFLSVAVDIDKAANQVSPVLMDSVKSALDQLGQLHF
jgi:hypothetical protein